MNKEPTFSSTKTRAYYVLTRNLHFLHKNKSILCMNKEPTFFTQKQEHTTMYEQGTYISYTKTRAYYV